MRERVTNTRMTLADKLITILGIAIVGNLYVLHWHPASDAELAIVLNPYGETMTVDLYTDHLHKVNGKLGASTLQVSGGQIRFLNSPCKQRVCIHSGWLKHSGEAAACLPNGVSLVLHSDNPRYDSINF